MNDLEKYINNFILIGNLSNNFDEFGNVNLNVSASKAEEIFISYDLLIENYDNQRIKELYDTTLSTNVNNNISS